MVSETINGKPVIHLSLGSALYKNRREASLRLSLPHRGNAIKLSGKTFLAPHRLNGLMSIPNLIALLLLSPVVIKVTKEHFAGLRK